MGHFGPSNRVKKKDYKVFFQPKAEKNPVAELINSNNTIFQHFPLKTQF